MALLDFYFRFRFRFLRDLLDLVGFQISSSNEKDPNIRGYHQKPIQKDFVYDNDGNLHLFVGTRY